MRLTKEELQGFTGCRMVRERRLSIIMLLPGLGPGGVERVVSTIANYWARQGRRIIICTLDEDDASFYPLENSIEHYILSRRNRLKVFPRSLIIFLKMVSLVRRERPLVLLSFLPHLNIISTWIRLVTGCPVVIAERNHVHGRPLDRRAKILRAVFYRFANLVTINNEENRQLLQQYVKPEKIVYVRNPITNVEAEIPSNRENLIVTIGRLVPQKNIEFLIQGFALSALPSAGWKMRIAGTGPEYPALLALARELDVCDLVSFDKPALEIWETYKFAKCFALVSLYEGMPNVLLEALSFGLVPIISDQVGDLVEPVRKIDQTLVVEVNSLSRLVNALNHCSNDQSLESLRAQLLQVLDPYWLDQAMVDWGSLLPELSEQQVHKKLG
jgi:GalNAc-alpha-(1->4)-GalNAc-alpha-(1->3)-diNAcBac-PP-undecaprenol alpha-1,4-N-acetyl-D-galactosaminyltransferase